MYVLVCARQDIPSATPFSHLLRAPSESCVVMPSCKAPSGKRLATDLTNKPLSGIARETDRRDGVKGVGLESGRAVALRQSLNKAGEKERGEQRGQDSPGVFASFF